MNDEHILIRLIRKRNEARRNKAHPKLIERINTQISKEAQATIERFRDTHFGDKVINSFNKK